MLANKTYANQSKRFWAEVKLVSMTLGYSRKGQIKVYTLDEVVNCLKDRNLETDHLVTGDGEPTEEGSLLVSYFQYRSDILHRVAEPNLMKREDAQREFDKLHSSFQSTVVIPYNKQKGEKRHIAYLTGILNLLTEKTLGSVNFDPDPRNLIVVTDNKKPLRVLSRRVDGAYPSTINPYAIWELKEYYGTTSFGSRVADGVYESLLDGHEIEELRLIEGIELKHYLIVDDYLTWWQMGKSYLCRLIDMQHAGYLDEVLFGREIITRWPEIVSEWPKDFTESTVSGREHLLQP